MKKMNKGRVSESVSFFLFFAVLIALPLITLFSKKESFSDEENRTLAKFPQLSFENVMDVSFMNGFENYFADHFTGRQEWVSAKAKMELISGKKEINGVFICDDMLLQRFDKPDKAITDKSVKAINKFAESYPENEVFFLLAPTSTGIYADYLPANAPYYSQSEFIGGIYSQLSENVTPIDIRRIMYDNRGSYIYYRTDHHWTTLGAYYAYNAAIKKMGLNPVDYGKYNIEHAGQDFHGTLYSKCLYDGVTPDVIDIYSYPAGAKVTEVEITSDYSNPPQVRDSIYFREYLEKKDKYSVFFGQNQPIITVKTDIKNAPRLLVIKDSYAHCFLPFLTENYSEITMVDMRYINFGFSKIVDVSSYDQTLFLYNAATFATDENIKKLSY